MPGCCWIRLLNDKGTYRCLLDMRQTLAAWFFSVSTSELYTANGGVDIATEMKPPRRKQPTFNHVTTGFHAKMTSEERGQKFDRRHVITQVLEVLLIGWIKFNTRQDQSKTLNTDFGSDASEIDLLFNTIVLPNINYALSVYAASESDLTPVQCFLDRCFKRKYTSKPVSVYDFLERQDRKIFKKVFNAKGHPLLSIMPRVKPSSYNLRKETCFKPKINTMRFKNSFINRLVFKYELAM